MQKTIAQLALDIYRGISPAKPSDSKDEYGAIVNAVELMLSTMKPKELSRRTIIENALYDQINEYTCPPDLDTNKIMQWYRLKNNREVDGFYNPMTQTTNREFDSMTSRGDGGSCGNYGSQGQNIFTIEWQSSKKFLKVSDFHGNTGLTLNDMNSITSNGTWNVSGNLVNLATDNLTYVAGSGSLRFNLNTSSNTGSILNTGMKPVDITSYLNVGKVFTWIDLPNINQLQTVTLNMYSSLTDYYSITVSSPHDTDQFQLGQNLLGFELDSSTMNTIGTPNPGAINQISFTFVTAGTLLMDSVRIDNVVARKGLVYGIQYISNQVFKDAVTGLMKWRPTDPSDIIILEYDTYQVLLAACVYVFAGELVNGANTTVIRNKLVNPYLNAMNAAFVEYKKRHKEEYIDETQNLRNFGVPYGWWAQQNFYGGNGGFRHDPNNLDGG